MNNTLKTLTWCLPVVSCQLNKPYLQQDEDVILSNELSLDVRTGYYYSLLHFQITFTVLTFCTIYCFFKMIPDFAWFISSHCIQHVITCMDISRLIQGSILTHVMHLKNAGRQDTIQYIGMINGLAPPRVINITRKMWQSAGLGSQETYLWLNSLSK